MKRFLCATGLIFAMTCQNICFAEGLGYEKYYLNTIKGNKTGYSSILQEEKTYNNESIIITKKFSEQIVNKLGFVSKITQNIEFGEDVLGNPLYIKAKINNLDENTEIYVQFISKNKILLTSKINNEKTEKEISTNKKILFPYAINNLFKYNPVGDIKYATIDSFSDFRIVEVTAKKINEIDPKLELQKISKYKASMDLLPNIESTQWRDSEGRLFKETTPFLGSEQTSVLKNQVIKDTAKKVVLLNQFVPVKIDCDDISTLNNITYKIETEGLNPENIFLNNDRQRIIQVKNSTCYIKTQKEQNQNIKNLKYINEEQFNEFLKTESLINPQNENIIQIASDLVQDDFYKTAKNIEKWIYENIENKKYDGNISDLNSILETKQANNIEHTILMTSLLRASKIPCLAVKGLVYNQESEKFVPHIWVQAYVGEWIYLDSAFWGKTFLPFYLAMKKVNLANFSDDLSLSFNSIKDFSKLKIKILNYSNENSNKTEKITTEEKKSQGFNFLSLINSEEDFSHKVKLTGSNKNSTNIEIGSKTKEYYVRKGFYDFTQGEIEKAAEGFEKASELIDSNDIYLKFQFARKFASMGLFSLSEKTLGGAYDKDIWDNQIQTMKNLYYPSIILQDKEEKILAQALSLIIFAQKPDDAINLLNDNLPNLDQSDFTHFLSAKAFVLKEEQAKAFEYLKKAMKINPKNELYKLEMAKLLTSEGAYKSAQKLLDSLDKKQICNEYFKKEVKKELFWLKSKTGDEFGSKYYLAKYYALKGSFTEAKALLAKLEETYPKNSQIYSFKGDMSYKLNDFKQAQKHYDNALLCKNNDIKALRGLGNISLLKGKYDKALGLYKKALKVDKHSIELLLNIAKIYRVLQEDKLANETYLKVLKLDKSNVKANYEKALIDLKNDDQIEAIALLKKTLSINPNYSKSWIKLADIAIFNENNVLARLYLVPVSHINDQNAEYYYLQGKIYKNEEKYSSARQNFKKAVLLNPSYMEAKLELKDLN